MDLISYAQNQEDVMLWRAVRHVRRGFYIDVGAAHPSDLSVTKIFYDDGWSGINIEPNPDYFTILVEHRPRDVNLAVVVASTPGERIFHHVIGTGLSTLDNGTALRHQQQGFEVKTEPVQCRTLADICTEYRPNAPIHFLKVDVEGSEGEVLKGADFRRFRPWIVLVEATRPMSQELDYASWEDELLQHDYRFVWFDGLNRFYIALEQVQHLIEHFSVQPNVFDEFVRAVDLIDRIKLSEAYSQNEKHAREQAQEHISDLASRLNTSEAYAGNERSLRVRAEARLDVVETQAQRTAAAAIASIEEAGRRKGEAEHRATIMDRRITDLEKLLEKALENEGLTRRKLDLALSNIDLALRRARSAAERLQLVESSLTDAEVRLLQSEDRRKVAEDTVKALLESTSWRVTRPFRISVYLLHGRIGLQEIFNVVFRRAPPVLRPPRHNNRERASIPLHRSVLSKEPLPVEVPVNHEVDHAFVENEPETAPIPLDETVPVNQGVHHAVKEVQQDLAPKADYIQLVMRHRLAARSARQQPSDNANMIRR